MLARHIMATAKNVQASLILYAAIQTTARITMTKMI